MSEDSTDMQLSFEFADPENDDSVHSGQQIAAPVDHSLDDDPDTDVSDPSEPEEKEVVRQFVYSEFARKEIKMEKPESAAVLSVPPAAEKEVPISVPDSVSIPVSTPQKRHLLQQKELQRASLAWLASQLPTAAAIRVPTRLAKFRADAAAFWSTPRKSRLLQPERTVVVEARPTRNSCWPECSGSEEIVPELRREHEFKEKLEAQIRKEEPQLLDSDVLFPEIEYWNYAGTKNPEYAKCLSRIRNYEYALYRGSRFERIQRADVANELYLAVPDGMIHPNELADGWGLLYISRNLSVKVIKKAPVLECPRENMLHLSQNIAASSLADVLFAHGVYLGADGKTSFRRPPRRRRFEQFD